jgi:hypothetical protein
MRVGAQGTRPGRPGYGVRQWLGLLGRTESPCSLLFLPEETEAFHRTQGLVEGGGVHAIDFDGGFAQGGAYGIKMSVLAELETAGYGHGSYSGRKSSRRWRSRWSFMRPLAFLLAMMSRRLAMGKMSCAIEGAVAGGIEDGAVHPAKAMAKCQSADDERSTHCQLPANTRPKRAVHVAGAARAGLAERIPVHAPLEMSVQITHQRQGGTE